VIVFKGKGLRLSSLLVTALLSGLMIESAAVATVFPSAAFWRHRVYSLRYGSATQSIYNNNCSGTVTIKNYNPNGVQTNVTSNLTINLSGPGTTTFYSDSSCTVAVTSVTITSGTSTVSYYFSDTSTSSITITAAAINYVSASQTESISANPYIWTGAGGNASWSTAANWSGGAAPGSSNNAVFSGSACSTNCSPTISSNINVAGVRSLSNYTGTITQGVGATITLGGSGWVQLNGNFVGGNSAFATSGNFNVSGGSFTFPTATLGVGGNYTIANSPTITITGSTLKFTCGWGATCTITPGSVTYNQVSFEGGFTTFSLGGATMTVGGNLTVGDTWGSAYNDRKINSGTINVSGNISVINYGYMGTATVVATGNPSGQTITGIAGYYLPSLKIDAGANNVTLVGTVQTYGSFTVASVGTLTTTGTTLGIYCDYGMTCPITPGTTTYNNVKLTGYYGNYDLGGNTFKVGGNFSGGDTYDPTYNDLRINNGTIQVNGNVSVINQGYQGTASIVLAGNASGQTLTGNGAGYYLPNITIAAGTNPVTVSGFVSLVGNFTMTSVGTFTTTGSTLYLGCAYGTTCTITPGTVAYNNVSIHGRNATLTLGGGTMNVNGNFELGDAYLGKQLNNGTINVYGNISVTDYGDAGTAWIVAKGNASGQTLTDVSGSTPVPNFRSDAGANSVTLGSAFKVAGSMAVASGTFGMAGYALNVVSNLSLSAGTTLNKSGGTLTYGSLSNSGTINP
jgi:hypothetical protein